MYVLISARKLVFEREDFRMYCTNCGKECNQDEKFCTGCGTALNVSLEQTTASISVAEPAPTAAATPTNEKKKFNVFAIVGFVISLVCFLGGPGTIVLGPLAGLIFSIVALVQIKKNSQKGKGLAVAGVILGAISTVVTLVVTIFTTLFSYALPEFLRMIINYVAPELLSMVGDQIETGVSDIIRDLIGDFNLSEFLKELFASIF